MRESSKNIVSFVVPVHKSRKSSLLFTGKLYVIVDAVDVSGDPFHVVLVNTYIHMYTHVHMCHRRSAAIVTVASHEGRQSR